MKITEIICEAHHSIVKSTTIGNWIVDIDSHFIVTLADRNVLNPKVVTNIVTQVCLGSQALTKVPRGTGVFVQDTVSNISIYLYRYKNKPNQLRLETVLTPDMHPKEPIIRIAIPPTDDTKIPAKHQKAMDQMKKSIQSSDRDTVSQSLEKNKDTMDAMSKMNRQQRRAFNKIVQRTR